MTNQFQNPEKERRFDLSERTQKFGLDIIYFLKTTKETTISRPIILQLVRSSTSIGANYMEADGAESKKDFYHKLGICKKEAKETLHWLRMLEGVFPDLKNEIDIKYKEANELVLIFSAIITRREK